MILVIENKSSKWYSKLSPRDIIEGSNLSNRKIYIYVTDEIKICVRLGLDKIATGKQNEVSRDAS